MKQVFTLIALLFMLSTAHAQAPNAILYQAAARNNSGAILASANISVRFTIRDAVASGTILYRETHAVTTSVQGLFSVNVGQGTVVSGSFTGINWGVNHKFMQVELDPAGGSSYIDMGTQQLLSVPYALFSGATRPTISSVGDTMFFGGGVYYIIPGISASNCVVSAGTITSASSVCTGSNISLTSSVAGGVWSSSNTSVAPIVGGNIMVGFSAGTTTVTYTVAAACGTATVTAVVTVNPVPAAGIISGAASVCADQTTTLSSTIAGGTWTSSNTSAATVSSAGVVSGVSAGVTTISYTITNGCGSATTSRSMTVNPLPFAGTVSGTAAVCVGSTTTLTSTGTGGTWSSSHGAIATINPMGVVTGVAAGTATISYKVVNSCGTSTGVNVVTVNPLPIAGTITGADTVMMSGSITLNNTTTGGTWSSSNTAVATVGTTGAVNGITVGSVTISYTVTNSCGTSVTTKGVYVRPLVVGDSYGGGIIAYILQPSDPGFVAGQFRAIIAAPSDQGAIQWGCYGTLLGSTLQTIGSGAANTASVSASCGAGTAARSCADLVLGGYSDWYLPSKNELDKLRANRATIGGFALGSYWSSSESTVNNALLVNFNTGNALSVAKNEAFNVRAIRAISCPELPSSITGTATVCAGSTTTLSSATTGGTWSSSAPSIAIVSASGVVTGIAVGTATISYTVTESCGSASATRVVTVNTVPSVGAITGADTIAIGNFNTFTNSITGGTWSSSNATIATVGTGGRVTGISLGTANITYTLTNSCATSSVTKSVIIVTPLTIGATYGGGVIAYIFQPGDPVYVAGETHGLIAAPSDQSTGIQWWNGSYITSGATGIELGTGMANTNAIVAAQGSGSYAAKLCADLVLNGYSDWYLPNRHELEKLYINRSYIGGFTTGSYWSSSEYGNYAWHVFFDGGSTSFHYKYVILPVRAVRTF